MYIRTSKAVIKKDFMNEMICEKCGESFEAFKNTIFGKNLYVCPGCNKIQRRLGRDKKVGVSC